MPTPTLAEQLASLLGEAPPAPAIIPQPAGGAAETIPNVPVSGPPPAPQPEPEPQPAQPPTAIEHFTHTPARTAPPARRLRVPKPHPVSIDALRADIDAIMAQPLQRCAKHYYLHNLGLCAVQIAQVTGSKPTNVGRDLWAFRTGKKVAPDLEPEEYYIKKDLNNNTP